MKTLCLEVRDSMTFIPVLAVELMPEDGAAQYLMRRCGYGESAVMLMRLAGGTVASADPYGWADRTMNVAHHFILNHWPTLKDGDVIDVQFILGETNEPKRSERFTV